MRDVIANHTELLRAIHELREEWIAEGQPHSMERGSLFRRLMNLYACMGSEANEVAEALDPTPYLKEVA